MFLQNVINFDYSVVVPVHNLKDGKKDYKKTEKCYFCGGYFTSRMSRHLKNKHSTQTIIAEALRLENGARAERMRKVQHLGNFMHNSQVNISLIRFWDLVSYDYLV